MTTAAPTTTAAWPLLDKYFQSPNARYRLTQHHLQSYSDFVRYKIPTVLQDFNSWQHSEVFRGRDFARADAVDKATDDEATVLAADSIARITSKYAVFFAWNASTLTSCSHAPRSPSL